MDSANTMNILHENNFGKIATCSCCGDMQVTLGNINFTFTKEEYVDFDSSFNQIRILVGKKEEMKNRIYIVLTNREGVALKLSYKELKSTIELLNLSNLIMMADELIMN